MRAVSALNAIAPEGPETVAETVELPLEVTAEIHTRADKSAVEMRRILSELYAGAASAT